VGKYLLDPDLYYHQEHTWIKVEADGTVKVGWDDFGQKLAGKILFVRLPAVGKTLEQGMSFGTLETAKWTGDLIAPVSGTVVKVNPDLKLKPSKINEDPYGNGWLLIIQPTKLNQEIGNLLKGEQAIEWLKKEVREKAKEEV
jgi:glycine cleavage system H protein